MAPSWADLAQGLGWGTGKHTNLILNGNWFLAPVLTASNWPDKPEPNRCGHCTLFGGLPGEGDHRTLQTGRTPHISYWTIEYKGSIPMEMRPLIGDRVFSCDDCLGLPLESFREESERMKPVYLESCISPIWSGWSWMMWGLKNSKNALDTNHPRPFAQLTLGNTANAQALPALEKARQDPNGLIAEHARWAIDQIKKRLNSR